MGRVGEHLKKFHSHAAAHHGELAKCYGKIAGFGKTSKSDMKDKDGEGLADCLQKIAATHEAAAEFHKDMMAACEKAMSDTLSKGSTDLEARLTKLENTVVPTNVSAVTPDNPALRPVPRTGMRMPQRPEVPLQFAHLTTIEED